MAEETKRTIFTLDARDNAFWEIATEVFKLSEQQVFREIYNAGHKLHLLIGRRLVTRYPFVFANFVADCVEHDDPITDTAPTWL